MNDQLDYWVRQNPEIPLFKDLLWSKPLNKVQAGKLLIVGGSSKGFSSVAQLYNTAAKSGIGVTQLLLPASLQKTVGNFIPDAVYGPSTSTGSFSKSALEILLSESDWADGVVVGSELGNNSETTILLESYTQKFAGQLSLVGDAIDYFKLQPVILLSRPNTTIITDIAQLQLFLKKIPTNPALTSTIELLQIVEILHQLTLKFKAYLVVVMANAVIVAVNGQVSSTPLRNKHTSKVEIAARSGIWWLQNPSKPFEALTTAQYTK